MATERIRSPKLQSGAQHWYEYYAGYSEAFVSDLLEHLALPQRAQVLDPWNGSGTTTTVAHRAGLRAVGLDVNPVLVLVGKARALDSGILPSIPALRAEVCARSSRLRSAGKSLLSPDPLCWWMSDKSAHRVRSLETAIYDLLVGKDSFTAMRTSASLEHVSTLAAFFYVALFKTVREFLQGFRTSNPTWVKLAAPRKKVRIESADLTRAFRESIGQLSSRLADGGVPAEGSSSLEVKLGTAEATGLTSATIDAVIGSPPYCTRIDYAVSTRPELATLGIGGTAAELKSLRDSMLGTPTIRKNDNTARSSSWGKECERFLNRVTGHHTQASATYYTKYYRQYFAGLHSSITEAHRVLRPGGTCTLVVQDSYYKDVHCDLQTIASEMGVRVGLQTVEQLDFPVHRVRARMNKRSRRYRDSFHSTESAITLRKPA